MKKTTTTMVALAAMFSFANAQNILQKVYPTESSRASAFGKNIAIDDKTLIVADPAAFAPQGDTCAPLHGAVHVYKKNTNPERWDLAQTLVTQVQAPVEFGYQISLYKNTLLVTSRNERRPGDNVVTGALSLYRRNDSNSEFRLVTKVYAGEPWFDGETWHNSFFYAPCLNDTYVVAAVFPTVDFWVYNIAQDTLLLHKKQAFSIQPAFELGLTENNVVVGASNYILNYYKITKDTVQRTWESFFHGSVNVNQLAVSGNTVTRRLWNSFPKGDIVTSEIKRIGNDGKDSVSITFPVPSTENITSVALKEDKWLFTYNSTTSLITSYKYHDGMYSFAGSIYKPASVTSSFGNQMQVSENALAVGDVLDSTQTDRTVGTCAPKAGKGAVTTFYTTGFNIVTGVHEVDKGTKKPLLSPNPLIGESLSISWAEAEDVEVLNVTGTFVKKATVQNGTCTIGTLPKGVYMVKVSGANKMMTEKLVIE